MRSHLLGEDCTSKATCDPSAEAPAPGRESLVLGPSIAPVAGPAVAQAPCASNPRPRLRSPLSGDEAHPVTADDPALTRRTAARAGGKR
jgi:hypothetical protein